VYVRDTFRCGVLHLHTVKINVCEACPVAKGRKIVPVAKVRGCLGQRIR